MKSLKQIAMLAVISTLFATTLAIEINSTGSGSFEGHGVAFVRMEDNDNSSRSEGRHRGQQSREQRERLADLEQENKTLLSQSFDLKHQVDEAKRENSQIIRESDWLRKNAQRLKGSIQEQAELKIKSEEIEILVNGFKYQINRLGNIDSENGKLKQTVDDLERTNGSYKLTIEQLNNEIAELNKLITEMEEETKKNEEKEEKIRELKEEVEKKQAEIADLQSKIVQAKKAESDLKDKTSKKIDEIDEQINRKRNLVSELFEERQLTTALKSEAEGVKDQLDTKDKEIDLFKKRSESMESEIQHLKKLIEKMTSEIRDRDELVKQAAKLKIQINKVAGPHGLNSGSDHSNVRSARQANGLLMVGTTLDK